jgi:hypothetical protein
MQIKNSSRSQSLPIGEGDGWADERVGAGELREEENLNPSELGFV